MSEVAGQPKHHVTAPEDRIPIFQKFAYSMGSMANDSQAAWIGQMVAILILGLGINHLFFGEPLPPESATCSCSNFFRKTANHLTVGTF